MGLSHVDHRFDEILAIQAKHPGDADNIEKPTPDSSDFRFIMKKSLYKHFYTKTPNSVTFDVENGHHTPFLCH